MAYSRACDFLFCNLCGTMLSFNSPKYAVCPLCKSKLSTKEISGREISYRVTGEQIRKELGISFFDEGIVQLATTNKQCPNCGHNELEYNTRQIRSADEGQTTFYNCTKCGNTFREN